VIDKAGNTASLFMDIDSGPIFYFGDIEIEGLKRYSPELIYRYSPLQKGEIYDQNKVFSSKAISWIACTLMLYKYASIRM